MTQSLSQLPHYLFRSRPSTETIFQVSLAIVRITIGLMMIHNSLDKLADVERFAKAYVEVIGLPFPIFFSYVAGYMELIGGPLVAIGLLTRPAALGVFATMLTALYHHLKVAGLNVAYLELSAIYASGYLFFLINGAGRFSVDTVLFRWLSFDRSNRLIDSLMRSDQTSESADQSDDPSSSYSHSSESRGSS